MDRKGDSTFRAAVGTECGKRRKSKLEASACTWLGTLGCVCVCVYVCDSNITECIFRKSNVGFASSGSLAELPAYS